MSTRDEEMERAYQRRHALIVTDRDDFEAGWQAALAAAQADTAPSFDSEQLFETWFVKNYRGPDTIIHDPRWHAPKILRAARAGIELPLPYRLGFNNANCIGCVKGGEGYMNKVRREFPVQFERLAEAQESIGPSAYLFRDRKTGERFSLRALHPSAGRHNELLPECGIVCELVEDEIIEATL
jgi:hypothetical protein